MQANDDRPSGNAGKSGRRPSEGLRAPTDADESAESKEMARERREEVRKGKRKARSPVPVDEQRERNRQRRRDRDLKEAGGKPACSGRSPEGARRDDGAGPWGIPAVDAAGSPAAGDDSSEVGRGDVKVVRGLPGRQGPVGLRKRDLNCIIDDSIPGCRECEWKGVPCLFEDDASAPVKKTEKIPVLLREARPVLPQSENPPPEQAL
ncbi:hypothetical protein C8F01DRAFT_1094752 [Mycena amicta]|nr:hypothetical protein C8F01DRAFT_1094752 [Mycena amicta]